VTDLLALGIVALILLSAIAVLFAVTLRQNIRDSSRALDEFDIRRQAEITSLLNRLMAVRWEDFISVEETTAEQVGGFYAPGESSEDETMVGGQWSAMSRVRERAQALDENEEQILREDFPEETK